MPGSGGGPAIGVDVDVEAVEAGGRAVVATVATVVSAGRLVATGPAAIVVDEDVGVVVLAAPRHPATHTTARATRAAAGPRPFRRPRRRRRHVPGAVMSDRS